MLFMFCIIVNLGLLTPSVACICAVLDDPDPLLAKSNVIVFLFHLFFLLEATMENLQNTKI